MKTAIYCSIHKSECARNEQEWPINRGTGGQGLPIATASKHDSVEPVGKITAEDKVEVRGQKHAARFP
jgi:hypothetical protein